MNWEIFYVLALLATVRTNGMTSLASAALGVAGSLLLKVE